MKTAKICCSKTCVNFGQSCGNQGLAEVVENDFFLKVDSFKLPESFMS